MICLRLEILYSLNTEYVGFVNVIWENIAKMQLDLLETKTEKVPVEKHVIKDQLNYRQVLSEMFFRNRRNA